MRMWKVDPSKLCRKHLLGEHVEMHMFVGAINSGNIGDFAKTRYISDGLVEVHNIQARHDELVMEMTKRGYNHKTPLVFSGFDCGKVDILGNEKELGRRCRDCKFEDDGLPSSSARKRVTYKKGQ